MNLFLMLSLYVEKAMLSCRAQARNVVFDRFEPHAVRTDGQKRLHLVCIETKPS